MINIEMLEALKKLVGLELNELRVAQYYTELIFVDELNYHLTINKPFKFSFGIESENQPGGISMGKAYSSEVNGNYIFFKGLKCNDLIFEDISIQLLLENGSKIDIYLEDDDFEALQFTGYDLHGENPLVFLYVT